MPLGSPGFDHVPNITFNRARGRTETQEGTAEDPEIVRQAAQMLDREARAGRLTEVLATSGPSPLDSPLGREAAMSSRLGLAMSSLPNGEVTDQGTVKGVRRQSAPRRWAKLRKDPRREGRVQSRLECLQGMLICLMQLTSTSTQHPNHAGRRKRLDLALMRGKEAAQRASDRPPLHIPRSRDSEEDRLFRVEISTDLDHQGALKHRRRMSLTPASNCWLKGVRLLAQFIAFADQIRSLNGQLVSMHKPWV